MVEVVRAYRGAGVLTVALVNREESPLAQAAEVVLPLHAGEERAVAATKSFLAMLAATVHLMAHLLEEPHLKEALPALPRPCTGLWGRRGAWSTWWRRKTSSSWGGAWCTPWPSRPPSS